MSAPWNPSRNQDKDRSILSASTSTGCNLIFTGYLSAGRDGKGFPPWNFNCEDFPRVVTPAWHFSWLNALRFKKGFLKIRDFPRMNGIRRWNVDELIPGEVNFTVEERFGTRWIRRFFLFFFFFKRLLNNKIDILLFLNVREIFISSQIIFILNYF